LTEAARALVAPMLPAARRRGRPRTSDLRSVVNAIDYLLSTGCQWRLLPHDVRPWVTIYHFFWCWDTSGVWIQLHRTIDEQVQMAARLPACRSVVIKGGQSAKTTELGGTRGLDAHKPLKERKRILVGALGW
jgi:transposase